MKHDESKVKGGGTVLELVRETADGLGRLVIQHVKLAQLELAADLRAMGSRAAVMAVLAVLMIVGYTLAMAGVALLVAGSQRLAIPFLCVGGAHVMGTGIGMLLTLARLRRIRLLKSTSSELGQSASILIAAAHDPGASPLPGRPRLERASVP